MTRLRRLQLELVNACNYRCPLCRTLEDDGVTRRRMRVDELARLIAPVAPDLTSITLHGTRGEPFLHPELEACVATLKRATAARVELSTNGSLVTPARARGILAAGLDRIVFAIDGLTPESYARYRVGGDLERVLRNLRELCEQKACGAHATTVVFQLIPMAHNEAELDRLPALADSLGVDEVRLKISSSVTRSPRFRPKAPGYLPEPAPPAGDRFGCPFGVDQLYVDPNGDCFPCCYAEGHPELRVGNALETPLDEVWRGESLARFRRYFAGEGDPHPFCQATCARRRAKRKLKLALARPRPRPRPAGPPAGW